MRPQITTDGLKLYIKPIEDSFGAEVDYAMLVKLYGEAFGNQQERRYSNGQCCGTITIVKDGVPAIYILPENVTRMMVGKLSNKYGLKPEWFYHPDMLLPAPSGKQ